MGTDEWDNSGLRVGPWVTDAARRRRDESGRTVRRPTSHDAPVAPPDGTADLSLSNDSLDPDREPSDAIAHSGVPAEETDADLGRRRAATPPRRRWVIVGALVAAVGTAVAVPLALTSSPSRQQPSGTIKRLPGSGVSSSPVVGGSSPATATTVPLALSPDATPSAAPSHSPSHPPSSLRYAPVSYEAEASSNILDGAASVTTSPGASGDRIVESIGTWGPGAKRNGALTIPDVAAPADDTYTLTLFYVDTDSASTQTAVVAVAGGATVTVTVARASTCCFTAAVRIALNKGNNTITFNNPDGRAPSIDKIVISKQ